MVRNWEMHFLRIVTFRYRLTGPDLGNEEGEEWGIQGINRCKAEIILGGPDVL